MPILWFLIYLFIFLFIFCEFANSLFQKKNTYCQTGYTAAAATTLAERLPIKIGRWDGDQAAAVRTTSEPIQQIALMKNLNISGTKIKIRILFCYCFSEK